MRWSFSLGRIAGIETRIHATFALLVAWIAATVWTATPSFGAVIGSLLFTAALFGSVLLHELGHALTARRYGIATRAITLLPIGGVAQLEGTPRTARAELAVAIAGPAVNFALAAGLWLITLLASSGGAAPDGIAEPLRMLALANLGLGVFNLLPAFPMDGGRVLRALLQPSRGRLRATELAAAVGRVLAVGMGIVGVFADPWLAVIAVFVWFAAGRELHGVRERAHLEQLVRAAEGRRAFFVRTGAPLASYGWLRGPLD